MATAQTHSDLLEKARVVQRMGQRVRNLVLKGAETDRAWMGMEREPTLPQLRALLVIDVIEPCTLKRLAEGLGISGPAASEMVERLVDMNLVLREQDPEDRRRILISLNPEAKERVGKHEAAMLRELTGLLSRLSPQDVEMWVELAKKVNEVLDEDG